jgi:hypothetical protein
MGAASPSRRGCRHDRLARVNEDRISMASHESDRAAAPEPPRVYFAACGAQCDVFWWARRKAQAEPAPAADSPPRDRD